MIMRVVVQVAQAVCLLIAATGLYLLAGLGWALLAAGLVGTALATLAELVPARDGSVS